MFKIDMTGKACPLPVIQTHKALKEHDVVETIVDNRIATENLKRLADQLGCTYTLTEESPERYVVVIAKNGQAAELVSGSRNGEGRRFVYRRRQFAVHGRRRRGLRQKPAQDLPVYPDGAGRPASVRRLLQRRRAPGNGRLGIAGRFAEAGADGRADLRLRRLPQFLRADG